MVKRKGQGKNYLFGVIGGRRESRHQLDALAANEAPQASWQLPPFGTVLQRHSPRIAGQREARDEGCT